MNSLQTRDCQRCGHSWIARVERPVRCPSCQSPYWNKPRREPKGESK